MWEQGVFRFDKESKRHPLEPFHNSWQNYNLTAGMREEIKLLTCAFCGADGLTEATRVSGTSPQSGATMFSDWMCDRCMKASGLKW
jgi:hypothetical protein